MSKFKVLALAATLVMATAGLAIAGGDCASKTSAETASASGCSSAATAETAAAKTASAEGCASTAAAQTASAEGCTSSAAVKTASAEGCSSAATAETAAAKTASAGACGSSASTAAVKTAGAEGCASSAATAQTAGAGCASDASVSAQTVQLETVRMPSGAMAVFYNGTNAETVAYLQSKANEGCSGFVCDMAKGMAADENVTTEIAVTEHGVMILVTAKSDVHSVDKYEEQYAAVVASMDDEQGE